MAIAFSKYINITSGVGAGVTVAQRELIGRLFTTNALVPTGSYVEFDSAAEVGAYFGTTTEEYKRALYYFSFISKNITTPQKISFASYQPASTAPKIFGAPITSSLSSFTSIANGSLHIQMGSFSTTFSSIDFTGLTSFAQVAAKLTTYIINYTTGGTLWTSAAVTYNSTTASFNLVGGAVGNAVISITPGISADISPLIGWNSPQTIFSNGISAQQPSDALVASTQASTNFGSFLFIPALTLEEITAAAIWNDSQNILYQYMIPILTITDAPTYSTALLPYGGSAMTLSFTSGEYPEMLPMMILAATNYAGINSVQNYMYQQSSLTPSVTDTTVSNSLDSQSVNYYGVTQTAGQFLAFYQRGYLTGMGTDPTDMNTYANEQWLKDAAGAVLMTVFLSLAKVSANDQGRIQIITALQSVISQALLNGTISVNKFLLIQQIVKIGQLTGDPNAWQQVQSIGYWLNCEIVPIVVNSITEYQAVYTLVYSKDDIIRSIKGTHVLI